MKKILLSSSALAALAGAASAACPAVTVADPMGVGESDTYVLLAPRDRWTTARDKAGLVAALRSKLEEVTTSAR